MTLWPFQHVVCFSLPYERSFVAPRCSPAYCLHWLCVAALIAFPLLATFASDNVWIKESFYREQPVVAFAHDLALVLVGDSPADAVAWGTRVDLEPLLPEQVHVPTVRSGFRDDDHDGVADYLTLSLDMPTSSANKGYRSLLLMAVYNFQLREKVNERFQALAVIDASSPYPATGVWVHGQLVLRQRWPLHVKSEVRAIYDENPLAINWTSSWAAARQPMTFRALLERYAARSVTTGFELLAPPVWDYTPRESFHVQVMLQVAPQQVYYVPGALEVIKFAWMQVLSFLVPLWLVLRWVKAFAFDHQVVETYVVPHLPGRVG